MAVKTKTASAEVAKPSGVAPRVAPSLPKREEAVAEITEGEVKRKFDKNFFGEGVIIKLQDKGKRTKDYFEKIKAEPVMITGFPMSDNIRTEVVCINGLRFEIDMQKEVKLPSSVVQIMMNHLNVNAGNFALNRFRQNQSKQIN